MPVLTPITTKQRKVGVQFVVKDANGNAVVPAGDPGINLTIDKPNSLSVINLQKRADQPVGSTYTADLIAGSVPDTVTVTVSGVNTDSAATPFSTQFTQQVLLDPSTPGLATHVEVTDGVIQQQ